MYIHSKKLWYASYLVKFPNVHTLPTLTTKSLIGQNRISKKFDLVHPGVPVMLLPLVVVYVEHTCKIVSGNSDVVGL